MTIPPHHEQALAELRVKLVRHRPPKLQPDQGEEAFQQHKLLASAVHQAALLDLRGLESEGGTWTRYMTSYFPAGRNHEADASLLWKQWRTSLLKKGAPGPRVLITHGQPALHWHREPPDDRLCINLEDMWTDFDFSVGQFLAYLRTDSERRAIALERSRKGEVEVVLLTTMSMPASGYAAPPSVTGSATTASGIGRS